MTVQRGRFFREVCTKSVLQSFIEELTRSLYFKNLDNNAGVFHRLLDDAEEEECKEAMSAYYFLLTSPEPLTADQLDTRIEQGG